MKRRNKRNGIISSRKGLHTREGMLEKFWTLSGASYHDQDCDLEWLLIGMRSVLSLLSSSITILEHKKRHQPKGRSERSGGTYLTGELSRPFPACRLARKCFTFLTYPPPHPVACTENTITTTPATAATTTTSTSTRATRTKTTFTTATTTRQHH